MSLSTVTTGQTIAATHVNQLVNVLQAPSGGTETGGYYITFAAYVNAAVGGTWINSESRGVAPVSVSINTSVQSALNTGAPSTDHNTVNGFHVFVFANNGVQPSCNVGGVYTIQY